jgi:hypothetical protein
MSNMLRVCEKWITKHEKCYNNEKKKTKPPCPNSNECFPKSCKSVICSAF